MTGGPEAREPIADIVGRVVEDGRAAAMAEIGVIQAIVRWRTAGLKVGVPLLILALFLTQAVVTALLVGLILALSPAVGPGWATVIVVVGALVVIGVLAWLGAKRCQALFAPLPEKTP